LISDDDAETADRNCRQTLWQTINRSDDGGVSDNESEIGLVAFVSCGRFTRCYAAA